MGAWVDFGNREAGQLDRANIRGDAILAVGDVCDRALKDAKKKVEKRGLFR